jgi:hypothetical protein
MLYKNVKKTQNRNIYLICANPIINIAGTIIIDEKIFPFNIKVPVWLSISLYKQDAAESRPKYEIKGNTKPAGIQTSGKADDIAV